MHQFVRSFRHMHNENLKPIIQAYCDVLKGKVTKHKAKEIMLGRVSNELESSTRMLPWDAELVKIITEQKSVQDALHEGLLTLGPLVVLLEWCTAWQNNYRFWKKGGPGRFFFKENQENFNFLACCRWSNPKVEVAILGSKY